MKKEDAARKMAQREGKVTCNRNCVSIKIRVIITVSQIDNGEKEGKKYRNK